VSRWLPHPISPTTLEGATIWLGAAATLAVFSFLYRENRAYRFAEHILLGLGVGFGVAVAITDVLIPKWWVPLRSGDAGSTAFALAAAALGLMWYGHYHPRTVWLSRIVMGLVIGAGAGIALNAGINDRLPRIVPSFKSAYIPPAQATIYSAAFNILVFLVILFSVLSYFFWFERKGRPPETGSGLGRVFLMIAFGIFFGNAIMTRVGVFIERVSFLLTQWLRIGT